MAARVTPSGPTPHKLKLGYSYISQPVVEGLTGDTLKWTQVNNTQSGISDVAGTITKALLHYVIHNRYQVKSSSVTNNIFCSFVNQVKPEKTGWGK